MKSIILFFSVLLTATCGYCQTNTFPATGNAGIGTLSPAGKLQVTDNNLNYYVNKAITGQSEDAQGPNYILLHEIYTGTLSIDHHVMGKIIGVRGSVSGLNRKLSIEVNTATAYNTNRGSIITYNEPARLVTLVYASKSYLALEIQNGSRLYSFSFTGYAMNEALQLVKDDDVSNVTAFAVNDAIGIMGNVSIGTNSNGSKLDISGGPIWTSNTWYKAARLFNNGAIAFTGTAKSFGMGVKESNFYFFNANADGSGAANYYLVADGLTGNVGIGTTPAANYKLVVDGAFSARKVKVQQNGWADYVFYKNYNLPSLHEIEQFIHVNKHLPGIPSASDVAKEGVDLGEMNKLLLQKIEELTLHVIELNKKVETLEAERKVVN